MIQLRRHRRLGASVALTAIAAFVGASAADARGLDPCPHHDAFNLAHYGAAAHGGHEMADMAGTEHMRGHGRTSDKDGHEHGPCDCVGSCDTGGSPPLVTTAFDVAAVLTTPPDLTPPAAPIELGPTKDVGWTPYLPEAPPLPV